MSRIDFQGNILSYYSEQRKIFRWYKKLGFHIIHMMLFNSYILYKRAASKMMSLYNFKFTVIEYIFLSFEHQENVMNGTTSKAHLQNQCPKKDLLVVYVNING